MVLATNTFNHYTIHGIGTGGREKRPEVHGGRKKVCSYYSAYECPQGTGTRRWLQMISRDFCLGICRPWGGCIWRCRVGCRHSLNPPHRPVSLSRATDPLPDATAPPDTSILAGSAHQHREPGKLNPAAKPHVLSQVLHALLRPSRRPHRATCQPPAPVRPPFTERGRRAPAPPFTPIPELPLFAAPMRLPGATSPAAASL